MRRILTAVAVAAMLLTGAAAKGQSLEKYAFIVVIDGAMSRPEATRIFNDIEDAAQGANCHPDPEFGCEYYTFVEDPMKRAEVLLVINGDVFQSVSNLLDRNTILNDTRLSFSDVLTREQLQTLAVSHAYHNIGATHARILFDGDRANQVPLLTTFVSIVPATP